LPWARTPIYQPIEARYRLTRQVLEVCLETRHPVTSPPNRTILHDIDLLSELARHHLTAVAISVTSLDARLSRCLNACGKSLQAVGRHREIEHGRRAGMGQCFAHRPRHHRGMDRAHSGRSRRARGQGRKLDHAAPAHEVAPLFREWLDAHFPDRADKVMHIVQSMRGGAVIRAISSRG
jgi:hypothetical protein